MGCAVGRTGALHNIDGIMMEEMKQLEPLVIKITSGHKWVWDIDLITLPNLWRNG